MSQLYKVKLQSTTLDGDVFKSTIILSAHNQEEVELNVRYFFEVQRQEKYHITSIEKIKDKFYQLNCHEVKDNPDMVQKLKENSINRFTPTNQNKNVNCISVGIAGVCCAKDEEVVQRKLGSYLTSIGRGITYDNPFIDEGVFIFDPLGEVDPTRSPKIENIYKNIRLFRGGAPSLGKSK